MTYRFSSWLGQTAIEFGRGRSAEVAELMDQVATGSRIALITTPSNRSGEPAEKLRLAFGPRLRTVFGEAEVHTPAASIQRAKAELPAVDGLLALGGGSAIGLAKALAVELDLPFAALPTTYSGSEMTSLFGILDGGKKHVERDRRAMASLVVYDPELADRLPEKIALGSALNCLGHCLEASWLLDSSPLAGAAAERACAHLGRAIQRHAEAELKERTDEMMVAAWLGGVALAAGGIGLHHSVCHVLGGITGASHATIHGLVLPHVVRLAARQPNSATDRFTEPLAAALGLDNRDPGAVVERLLGEWQLPRRLGDFWDGQLEVEEAARRVLANGASSRGPGGVSEDDIRQLMAAVA